MILLLFIVPFCFCAYPPLYKTPPIPQVKGVDLISNPYGPKLPPIAIAHECCEGVRNGPEVVYYAAPTPTNIAPCIPGTITMTVYASPITSTVYAQPVTNTIYITQPPSYITTTQTIPVYYTLTSTQTIMSNVFITNTETRTVTDTVYVPQPVQPPPLMIQQQAATPVMPPVLVKNDGNIQPQPNIGNQGGNNPIAAQPPNLMQQISGKVGNNPINRPQDNNQPLIVQQAPSQPVVVQEAPHRVLIQ